MRKIILAIMMAVTVSGCDKAELDANMAEAKRVLAAINQGARVTASAVRQGIDAACASQDAVYTAAMVSRSILVQQTGPNTTKNIDRLDRAIAGYNRVCASASNPNATDLASLLSTALAAYSEVKAAQAAAGG